MRKLKLPLFLLLVAALITAGAFLPQITGAVMDQMRNGAVSTAPIQSVELQFRGGSALENMMKKLAMESRMTTIPITGKEATMTEDEVYAAVEECMDMYVSNKIFSWFEETYRTAEPYLAINPNNTEKFGIFWAVNIVREDDPYHNLFLHLDDETGRITYLDYVTYDPNSSFYPEDQSYVVNTLASIYFEQLGLTDLAEPFTSQDVAVDATVSNDIQCLRYTFLDTEYGELAIEFYCKPKGFYILFPN